MRGLHPPLLLLAMHRGCMRGQGGGGGANNTHTPLPPRVDPHVSQQLVVVLLHVQHQHAAAVALTWHHLAPPPGGGGEEGKGWEAECVCVCVHHGGLIGTSSSSPLHAGETLPSQPSPLLQPHVLLHLMHHRKLQLALEHFDQPQCLG